MSPLPVSRGALHDELLARWSAGDLGSSIEDTLAAAIDATLEAVGDVMLAVPLPPDVDEHPVTLGRSDDQVRTLCDVPADGIPTGAVEVCGYIDHRGVKMIAARTSGDQAWSDLLGLLEAGKLLLSKSHGML